MTKSFWAILIGVMVGLFAVFFLLGGKDDSGNNTFEGDAFAVQQWDHVKGQGNTGVAVIEYADFACPACSSYAPLLNQLSIDYEKEISIVFRHFPLTNIHPNSFAAHRAAEAAGNQGKFWEMHDILFARQTSWAAATSGLSVSQAADLFEVYATELQLDMEKYVADVASQETFDAIDLSIESGNSIGVNSTPSIYLNGVEVDFRSYDELKALVDEAIAASNSEETPNDNNNEQSQ